MSKEGNAEVKQNEEMLTLIVDCPPKEEADEPRK